MTTETQTPKCGGDNFIKLWRMMHDRFTNKFGLDNLIWVLGYSGGVKDGWVWAWFLIWHTEYLRNNDPENLERVYNSDKVITLDKLSDTCYPKLG